MRTVVSSLALVVLVGMVLAAEDPPADEKKDAPPAKKETAPPKKSDAPLQVGADLPGPFHPLNVTGPHKQRFHSLISEHGLDPMVMIFFKNVDFSDPLPDLLKKLDTAIDKNPEARLGSFLVFLPDDPSFDVVGGDDKSDDARRELEKQIEQAGSDMKLKHVVLGLDNKPDVEKYGLSESNLITVVLYAKLKVVAVYALPKSDFTSAAVEKILTDVAGKLGAKRKEKK